MNKKILITSFFVLLLLTGCNGIKKEEEKVVSNKLTCSCSEETKYVGYESETLVFHYDKEWKKIDKVDFNITYEVSEENMKDFDDYVEELEDICATQEADKCNVTKDGNKVFLDASGRPDIFGFQEELEKDILQAQLLEDADEDNCTCK